MFHLPTYINLLSTSENPLCLCVYCMLLEINLHRNMHILVCIGTVTETIIYRLEWVSCIHTVHMKYAMVHLSFSQSESGICSGS